MSKIKIHGKAAMMEFDISSIKIMYDPDRSGMGTVTIKQGNRFAILRGQFSGPGGAFTKSPDEVFATQHIGGDLENMEGVGLWALAINPSPAAALGRSRSEKKASSSRENGKKGGRPPKKQPAE